MKPTSSNISLIASFFFLTLRCWESSLYGPFFTPFLSLHTWPLYWISLLFLSSRFYPRPVPSLSTTSSSPFLVRFVLRSSRRRASCALFLLLCETSIGAVGSAGDLWLTLSRPLSGAAKALCAAEWQWRTSRIMLRSLALLHSGHCRLHLAPWFMDAILAPERDMKGSLELCVWGAGGVEAAGSKAGVYVRPNVILKGTCWRCVLCAYVWI